MTYQQKLEEARAFLTQHNSQIPDQKGKILVEKFFDSLVAAGGTNDSTLSQCTWEDLQDFGLPKLLARQVATIFRAKDGAKEEKQVFKKSRVEAMTVSELVTHYDPRDRSSLVFGRLQQLVGSRRFVVFGGDGKVNVTATVQNANELLDDYPEREHVVVDNEPCKTYKLGERPDQAFDENPLYPGRVLRPNGDCDQTNRSWAGVPLNVKQIVYLAVKNGEIKINSINDAHTVIDLVLTEDSKVRVSTRFVKSAAKLKELTTQGQAPILKIFKKIADEKPNNPFGTHKTY